MLLNSALKAGLFDINGRYGMYAMENGRPTVLLQPLTEQVARLIMAGRLPESLED